jgi:protein tyrosine phosphatase (PTP) superfamily phosphohydrolase (DUF442 family)
MHNLLCGYILLMIAAATAMLRADDAQPKATPQPSPIQSIENVWQVGPPLISGGEPGQTLGLQELKARGVKSLISVDGGPPPVAQARQLGLKYAHIPIGYDGISPEKQALLVQAFAQLPKPIYIHCHHGRHRGPAAAAIMARFGLGWSADEATAFMVKAGTAKDYPGLYESVRRFQVPDAKVVAALKSPLPETVDVSLMIDMMVEIDTRMDHLKAWAGQKLESKTGAGAKPMPEVNPISEAVQLRELVRESARLPECRDQPAAFASHFSRLETDLTRWIDALRAQPTLDRLPPAAQKNLATILKSTAGHCTACHRGYRDQKPSVSEKNR